MPSRFAHRDIDYEIDYHPAYSYALDMAGLPLIPSITVSNRRAHPSPRHVVSLSVLEHPIRAEAVVPELDAGATATTVPRFGSSLTDHLERLVQPIRNTLGVTIDGATVAELPFLALDAWRWPHTRRARAACAAYVLPHEAEVAQTVVEAGVWPMHARHDPTRTSTTTFTATATGDPVRAMTSLYRVLHTSNSVIYEIPKVERSPELSVTFQVVRAPHLIRPSLFAGPSRGNCFDLTAFFASCLEAIGHTPLIIFTGALDQAPTHAFLGCWTHAEPRHVPVIDRKAELLRVVDAGEMVILECTGVCRDRQYRLEFDAARDRALDILRSMSRIHAIDVATCRPPTGSVRPLELAFEPVVRRAVWEGERFRERMRQRALEGTHLLYGLCAAGSTEFDEIVTALGSSPARVAAFIEESTPIGDHTGAHAVTGNYRRAFSDARERARLHGRRTVREADLIWGVARSQSARLHYILEQSGFSIDALRSEMALRYPEGDETESIHVPRS